MIHEGGTYWYSAGRRDAVRVVVLDVDLLDDVAHVRRDPGSAATGSMGWISMQWLFESEADARNCQ